MAIETKTARTNLGMEEWSDNAPVGRNCESIWQIGGKARESQGEKRICMLDAEYRM